MNPNNKNFNKHSTSLFLPLQNPNFSPSSSPHYTHKNIAAEDDKGWLERIAPLIPPISQEVAFQPITR